MPLWKRYKQSSATLGSANPTDNDEKENPGNMLVGKNDTFERRYMAKFRLLASNFGEFVFYERDRGARDIGLHLTRKNASGNETISSTLCWFQLKGKMSSTLSREDFEKAGIIKMQLEVVHLKYWYLQSMPTYLVVYVEGVDSFLVLDIQEYVSKRWGRAILKLSHKSVTIEVPKNSALDEQAFRLILRKGDISQWVRVLEAPRDQANFCLRDYQLIYRIGTAEDRGYEQRLRFYDWLSKMRTQMYFEERKKDSSDNWTIIREHWQSKEISQSLEDILPYLDLFSLSPQVKSATPASKDQDNYPVEEQLFLKNGEILYGTIMFHFEVAEYLLGFKLNELGDQMFEWIKTMLEVGLLETNFDEYSYISVAPWHYRAV